MSTPRFRALKTDLTPAENRLLDLLANEGMSNKEMGIVLKISEETVKRHLSTILDKTGYSTRLELVVRTWQKRTAGSA
jgi:DNA-binding CsgD family transcriptional regulator